MNPQNWTPWLQLCGLIIGVLAFGVTLWKLVRERQTITVRAHAWQEIDTRIVTEGRPPPPYRIEICGDVKGSPAFSAREVVWTIGLPWWRHSFQPTIRIFSESDRITKKDHGVIYEDLLNHLTMPTHEIADWIGKRFYRRFFVSTLRCGFTSSLGKNFTTRAPLIARKFLSEALAGRRSARG